MIKDKKLIADSSTRGENKPIVMRCFGYVIPEDIIKSAMNRISDVFSVYELKRELEANGVPVYVGTDYISIAAASRIIQKMKKENKIKKTYGGGMNTVWKRLKK